VYLGKMLVGLLLAEACFSQQVEPNANATTSDMKDASSARSRKNFLEAYRLFQKAAEAGNVEALYQIARMYSAGDYGKVFLRHERGDREVPDLLAAYDYYKRAAEKGYAPAQLALGLIYFHGRGVSRDYTLALYNFQLSAAGNSPEAMVWLSSLLVNNQVVSQVDPVASRKWLEKAAELGYPDAQFRLASLFAVSGEKTLIQNRALYVSGNLETGGLTGKKDYKPEDLIMAYMWAEIAARSGHAGAGSLASKVSKLLSDGYVSYLLESKQRVSQWLDAHKKRED